MLGCMALISLGVFWDTYLLYSIGPLSFHFLASTGNRALATEIPTALFLGTFIGALTLGRIADKIGRAWAFTLNLLILAVGAIASAFSPVGPALIFSIFIAGIGTGAEIPLSVTYIQEIAPSSRRGRMSSLMLAFGFFGGTFGGLIAWWLSHNMPVSGFRISLLVVALGSVTSVLLRLRVPESPRWLERTGRLVRAEAAMTRIENAIMREKHLQTLPAPQEAVEIEASPEYSGLSSLFRHGYLRRTLSAWLIEFFTGFGSYGFTTFVPVILYARGYTLVHAIGYTAIIQTAYPIGTFISSFVTDWIPRKWGIAGFFFLNTLAGIGFYFSSSAVFIVIFGFLCEMLIFMDGPLLHTYEAEIYPTNLRGSGASTAFSVSRLGGFLAPLAAGVIVTSLGAHEAAPYLITMAAGSWLVCSIVAATLAVDTSSASLEQLERQALKTDS